jgi:hypothetical protein
MKKSIIKGMVNNKESGMNTEMTLFENYSIRRVYDEATETWWFSVVDIIQVLTQQSDYQAARNYWKVLKNRLNKEGSEAVTNCNQLKMTASDGKQRPTDAATAETLLRLIQSVPSPKAEPIKLWLAKVGYERMQDSLFVYSKLFFLHKSLSDNQQIKSLVSYCGPSSLNPKTGSYKRSTA